MTLFFSWYGIILKIFIGVFIGILELDNIKESLKSLLKEKVMKKDGHIPLEEQL